MLKHLNRTSVLILVVLILLLVFASGMAQAEIYVQPEIYKWRNADGVTQYSDHLPSNTSQQASHKTIISHLQAATKPADACAVAQKTSVASALNAYFSNTVFAAVPASGIGSRVSYQPGFTLGSAPVSKSNASFALFAGKAQAAYSPLSNSGFFNWAGRVVTIFKLPIKIAQITPKPKPTPSPDPTPTSAPIPAPAPAPTGKVFYIALSGDNNNPGTEALPWRNLNHAVYALKAGETVLVKSGTYQESLYINKSGAPGKPITYAAYPGHTPKIEINKPQLEGILIQGASYINIQGFEVVYTAPGAEAAKGEQVDNGIDISNAGQVLPHNINIKNNKVHGFPGGGIFTVLADYVTFEGNTVWENALWAKWGNSGISMYQNVDFDQKAGYHMVIRGNTLYKNENKLPSFAIGSTTITDGNCIIIDDLRHTQKFLDNKTPYSAYKANTLIENNVCYDNGARGIHVYASDNVLVLHNTLYKNQRTASINDGELSAYDASNVRFVNNIVFTAAGKHANGTGNATNIIFQRNVYFGTSDIPNKSANDIIGDPLFVSPSINSANANFQLRASSPAIDAALTGQSPATDIAGKARQLGKAADIGAYESR